MASSVLELIYKTSKQGQGGKLAAQELKDVKNVVGDVVEQLPGVQRGILTAAGAVAAVGAVAIDAGKKFLDMGEQIRGLTALTGTGAEETSRLMQAFDDMGISSEKFGAIVESSAKKGFVFSLENVKALADEYNKLPTQVEKNALLQEKLGKGASAAAKAFAEGSTAIEGYYNAVSDGLAMTDQEVEQADKLRRNIDNLKDSWESYSMTLTGPAVEALNQVFDRQQKMIQLEEERGRGVRNMTRAQQDAAIAEMELAESVVWVAENAEEAKKMLGGYGDTAAGLPAQLDPAIEAQEELNTLMKSYSDQVMFNIMAENLSAEGKLALAESMGLIDEKTRFAVVKEQEWQDLVRKGKMTEEEKIGRAAALADQLSRMSSKDIVITTTYIENRLYGDPIKFADKHPGDGGRANGTDGWVTVPAGYPGDSYPVMMSSGERYQVQNDRQRWTGQGGQGGATINFSGPINISGEMDYQKFVNRLKADIRRGG
jgi:hypothetical protein